MRAKKFNANNGGGGGYVDSEAGGLRVFLYLF